MQARVYNQEGKETDTLELPKIFELPWNADLVHQVVASQQSNRRTPLAHAKGRGEVRGGGKKPWRQKGTGRARHGSIRSPLWKGGGVTHGPLKEKMFKRKINKKMAARALATVLSAKARDRELILVEPLSFENRKTKAVAGAFGLIAKSAGLCDLLGKKTRALLVAPVRDGAIRQTARNLPFLETVPAENITALDAMNHKYVFLFCDAVALLEKRLAKKPSHV